jgi:N-acetylmuramoyl-L-alanine amidase
MENFQAVWQVFINFLSGLMGMNGTQAQAQTPTPANTAPTTTPTVAKTPSPTPTPSPARSAPVSTTQPAATPKLAEVKSPTGKTNIIMCDVGHGGRVTKNGVELSRAEYNTLTLDGLTKGIKEGTFKISTAGFDAGATSITGKTEFEYNLYQAVATAEALRAKGWKTELFFGDDTKDKEARRVALDKRVITANNLEVGGVKGVAGMISFHNNSWGCTR